MTTTAANTAHQLSRECFWDVDPASLDMRAHEAFIIQRVLEYGTMNDWKFIESHYGLDHIVAVCKQLRSLAPTSLSFIATISHTSRNDYRCYRTAQSHPTPWNS